MLIILLKEVIEKEFVFFVFCVDSGIVMDGEGEIILL